MAQHELKAQIIVSGKEDGSLSRLGSKIQSMAAEIQGISNAAMDFLKDSVDTYKNYEDGMLETRSVLQSTYSSVNQLNRDMEKIESAAQHWAETTIFTTDDVANSIANAAHAGWDYEKILEGMPSAMLIAQAGHIELADGVDYLTKMMAATGTSFEDSKGFVNEWAKAADLAATDIDEVGQAFLKLGTASRLAGSNEELFAFTSVLANAGTTGTQAGTAIRNVMARIAAPTNKAEEAMEALGLSEEEAADALADLDEASNEAYQRLEEMGFSAYDAEGNLRPFMDILGDMNIMLGDMDEKSRNDFLKTLFGTKSFQYAMTLLDAANDGSLTSIYEAILGVRDTDYAERKMDTVMSGLTGSVEIMNSKWEEFKRKIGESVSSPLEGLIGGANTLIDNLNALDPGIISGVANAISVIAVSAPAMMGIGTAIKIIGSLGLSSGFAWAFAAAGIVGVATAIEKLTGIESKFGDVTLNTDQVNAYLDQLVSPYSSHAEEMQAAMQSIEEAKQSYIEGLSGIQGMFLTDSLTGETVMSDDAKTRYESYGKQMYDALMEGVQQSKSNHLMMLNSLFDTNNDGTSSPDELTDDQYNMYNQLFDAEVQLWNGAQTRVTEAINAFYAAVETAASQGWSEEAKNALQASIQELNAAQQEIAEYNADKAIAKALHKGETVSWDSFNETLQLYEDAKNSEIEAFDEGYYSLLASQRAAYNKNNNTDLSMADFLLTPEGMALESQRTEAINAKNAFWGEKIDSMIGQLLPSDYAEAFSFLKWASGQDAVKYYDEGLLGSDYVSANGRQLAAAYYKSNGYDLYNVDDPNGLYQMTMQLLNSPIGKSIAGTGRYNMDLIGEILASANKRTYDDTGWVGDTTLGYAMDDQLGTEVFGKVADYGKLIGDTVKSAIANTGEFISQQWTKWSPSLKDAWENTKTGFSDTWTGLKGEWSTAKTELTPVIKEFGASVSQTVSDSIKGIDKFFERTGTTAPESFMGIQPSSKQVTFVDDGSSVNVKDEDRKLFGTPITQLVNVTDGGTASSLWSSIQSIFANTITQNVNVQKTTTPVTGAFFAEGGRATEASIFGEAGAEWAIPEQHTERTAELLTRAANASGFTWGELLTRNGGLNAGSSGNTTIVYSPTINANNSDGVEKALRDDKDRLDKMLRERNMIHANTAYA